MINRPTIADRNTWSYAPIPSTFKIVALSLLSVAPRNLSWLAWTVRAGMGHILSRSLPRIAYARMSNHLDQETTLAGHSANSSGKSFGPKKRDLKLEFSHFWNIPHHFLRRLSCSPETLLCAWRDAGANPTLTGSRDLTQLRLLACCPDHRFQSGRSCLGDAPVVFRQRFLRANECHSPRVNLSNRSRKSSRLARRPPNWPAQQQQWDQATHGSSKVMS